MIFYWHLGHLTVKREKDSKKLRGNCNLRWCKYCLRLSFGSYPPRWRSGACLKQKSQSLPVSCFLVLDPIKCLRNVFPKQRGKELFYVCYFIWFSSLPLLTLLLLSHFTMAYCNSLKTFLSVSSTYSAFLFPESSFSSTNLIILTTVISPQAPPAAE